MNKTLKTFEDGSELTIAGVAFAGIVAVAATAGWIVVLGWTERIRDRRINKKFEGTN